MVVFQNLFFPFDVCNYTDTIVITIQKHFYSTLGSDVYDSSCVTEDDIFGLGHENCYSAVFLGDDIRTCQCREDECNTNDLDAALNTATSSTAGLLNLPLLLLTMVSYIKL